jgi:putative flippase GtrA
VGSRNRYDTGARGGIQRALTLIVGLFLDVVFYPVFSALNPTWAAPITVLIGIVVILMALV